MQVHRRDAEDAEKTIQKREPCNMKRGVVFMFHVSRFSIFLLCALRVSAVNNPS